METHYEPKIPKLHPTHEPSFVTRTVNFLTKEARGAKHKISAKSQKFCPTDPKILATPLDS
jgi:hypothetical protein